MEESLAWIWIESGQEPLALVHLLLLHLAEQCTEGPLIAQKGYTEGWGMGMVRANG